MNGPKRMPRGLKVKHCIMCHRDLREPVSRKRGMGPTCWGKRPSLAYAEL